MSRTFDSAEDLMEHLKKQILEYPDVDTSYKSISNKSYASGELDFSRFIAENEVNNKTWNVSADRPITSHRKFSGKFIVFGKKIVKKILRWYVSNTFEIQASFNGSVTRSFNEMYNIIIQLKAKQDENELLIKEKGQYIQQLETKINLINENMKSKLELGLKEKNYVENEVLDDLLNSLRLEDDRLKDKFEMRLNDIENQINNKVHNISENYRSEINFMQYRIRQINKKFNNNNHDFAVNVDSHTNTLNTNETDSNSFDYLHFENKFRGSIEEIKNRQRVYLPYFENKENVLDIGCGRGEFVELLIENNVSVKGIDLNREMVEYCQDRGLPVEYDDAINYLISLGDNELGGVFLGQVIEHLTFNQIIELVELAYSKLKAGSYLIMETPNPLSLAIFYRTFYVDPTHVKPVHPLTIQYLVESVGFKKAELIYSSRVEPNWWLPKLDVIDNSIKNVNEFNEGVNRVNDLLYGNLDYAILAKK